jgi:hypothetical protein
MVAQHVNYAHLQFLNHTSTAILDMSGLMSLENVDVNRSHLVSKPVALSSRIPPCNQKLASTWYRGSRKLFSAALKAFAVDSYCSDVSLPVIV